jgi:hypothetical protein
MDCYCESSFCEDNGDHEAGHCERPADYGIVCEYITYICRECAETMIETGGEGYISIMD